VQHAHLLHRREAAPAAAAAVLLLLLFRGRRLCLRALQLRGGGERIRVQLCALVLLVLLLEHALDGCAVGLLQVLGGDVLALLSRRVEPGVDEVSQAVKKPAVGPHVRAEQPGGRHGDGENSCCCGSSR
jgi:hypothetical protein